MSTIASMTGFARHEGSTEDLPWAWEARSVNGRSLDLRCRLAPGWEYLEPFVRAEAAKRFKRGSLSIQLSIGRTARPPQLQINRAVLDQILEVAASLDGAGAAAPRLDGLLALRGVIEVVDEDNEDLKVERERAMREGLDATLAALDRARHEEGVRLADVVSTLLDQIEDLVGQAAQNASAQPEGLRRRLKAMLDELLAQSAPVSEERLAQEVALLVGKADIREELDRLRAHVAQARDLVAGGGAVGRRLDFLCQEFNREANTLCSKSADVELTRRGLDLKASIEQLREQIQNIE